MASVCITHDHPEPCPDPAGNSACVYSDLPGDVRRVLAKRQTAAEAGPVPRLEGDMIVKRWNQKGPASL